MLHGQKNEIRLIVVVDPLEMKIPMQRLLSRYKTKASFLLLSPEFFAFIHLNV